MNPNFTYVPAAEQLPGNLDLVHQQQQVAQQTPFVGDGPRRQLFNRLYSQSQVNQSSSVQNSSFQLESENSQILLEEAGGDKNLDERQEYRQSQDSFEIQGNQQNQMKESLFSRVPVGFSLKNYLNSAYRNININKSIYQVSILIKVQLLLALGQHILNYLYEQLIVILERRSSQIAQISFEVCRNMLMEYSRLNNVIQIRAQFLEEYLGRQAVNELNSCCIQGAIKVFGQSKRDSYMGTAFYFDINKIRNILNKKIIILICQEIHLSFNKPKVLNYDPGQRYQPQQYQYAGKQSCIACCKSFQHGDIISDGSVNQTHVIGYPSIKSLNLFFSHFMQKACGLLNSGGGIILFGTTITNKKIFSKGQHLTEQERFQIMRYIFSLFKHQLHPKILASNNQIRVSFVPVFINILPSPEIFVTCVRICPKNGNQTYFLKSESILKCFSYRNQGVIELRRQQILKLIKHKFKKFGCKSKDVEKYGSLLRINKDIFEHNCKEMGDDDSSQSLMEQSSQDSEAEELLNQV